MTRLSRLLLFILLACGLVWPAGASGRAMSAAEGRCPSESAVQALKVCTDPALPPAPRAASSQKQGCEIVAVVSPASVAAEKGRETRLVFAPRSSGGDGVEPLPAHPPPKPV